MNGQVQGRLLLDVVIAKKVTIDDQFVANTETLVVWGNALLLLNHSLDVLNAVQRLNLQGNDPPGQCLDEY
jgi:hypothetical protein